MTFSSNSSEWGPISKVPGPGTLRQEKLVGEAACTVAS